MEYWKTTVTILLPLLANIFSYWGLLRSGGLNTRKYWLVEVRRPQYEKILASRGDWEWLYCDSSRGIRWNIAWALGKSLGLRPRDFPRAQAIFHRIPLLSSQYSYSITKPAALLTSGWAVGVFCRLTMSSRHLPGPPPMRPLHCCTRRSLLDLQICFQAQQAHIFEARIIVLVIDA